MGKEIVVEGAHIAADGSREAMFSARRIVLVAGNVERFGDEVSLERDVVRGARREGLVNAPSLTWK